MAIETLTQLQYSQALRGGSFALYIYSRRGYHSGAHWFSRLTRDGEISLPAARSRALKAEAEAFEVRICDGDDMLVYHSRGGVQLYPTPRVSFWEAIGA